MYIHSTCSEENSVFYSAFIPFYYFPTYYTTLTLRIYPSNDNKKAPVPVLSKTTLPFSILL